MSTLAYNEPYKFTALLATLAIHAVFFAVLYFGVNWQVKEPEGMEVEIWNALPEPDNRPAPSVQPVVAEPPPPQEPVRPQAVEKPAPPAKPDIDMAEKKKKTAVKPKEQVKPEPAKKLSKAERKRMEEEARALEKQQELADQRDLAAREAQAAKAAEARAAAAAAISSEVGKYIGLIRSKIRNNLTMPPDVADDALAEFEVTLLPSGELLNARKVKSSGSAAYDNAVERAIHKAEPLPLPPDDVAREQFINPRSLRLKFSPTDRK